MPSPTPCRCNRETSSSSTSLQVSFSTQHSSCEHQNSKGPLTLTPPTSCGANNRQVGVGSERNEESSSSTTSLPVPLSLFTSEATISPSPSHCFEHKNKKVAATTNTGGNHAMLIASRLTLPAVSRQIRRRSDEVESITTAANNSRGDEEIITRISSNIQSNKRNNDAHQDARHTKNCDTSSNSETEQLILISQTTHRSSCSSRATTRIMTHPDSFPPMKHATFSTDDLEIRKKTSTKENPKPTCQAVPVVATVSEQHIKETASTNKTAATIHASTMTNSSTTESSTQKKTPTITTTTVTTTAKAPTDAIMNGAATGEKYSSNLSTPTSTSIIRQMIPSTLVSHNNQATRNYEKKEEALVSEKKQSPQNYEKKEEAKTIDTPAKSPKKEVHEVATIKNTNNNNNKTMSIITMDQDEEAVSSSCHSIPPAQNIKTVDKIIAGGCSPNDKNKISSSSSPTSNKRKRSSSTASSTCTSSSSPSVLKPGQTSGRWTQEEHQAFLEGLKDCGREWKKVSLRIPTRTSAQIRSHAQKYFSKLQRDQESSIAAATALATPFMNAEDESGNFVVVGEGGYISGTIVTSNGGTAAAPLAPSIRRKVERIVSNPRAAQREVENTLDALRERYRQLQQRLDDRQRLRQDRIQQQSLHLEHHQQEQRLSNVAGEREASAASGVSSSLQNNNNMAQEQHHQQQHRCSRKRMKLPINHYDVTNRSPSDGNSSVSSTVSSIAASRSDLGDKEIIALEVLGGTLSRGDSANDLHVLAAEAGDNNKDNNNISLSLSPRGDSSIEEGVGMATATNDNISSSTFGNAFAPLPPVVNENNPLQVDPGVGFLNSNNDCNNTPEKTHEESSSNKRKR